MAQEDEGDDMAIVNIEGTSSIQSDTFASPLVLGFLWCTVEDIQKYLDQESTIQIGDGSGNTFSLNDAMRIENDVVRDIIDFLSSVYEIDVTSILDFLISQTSRLTAAAIGVTRFAASMGISEADWTNRYKNEAWAALRRSVINQSTSGLVKKSVPIHIRLIYAKTRERAVISNA